MIPTPTKYEKLLAPDFGPQMSKNMHLALGLLGEKFLLEARSVTPNMDYTQRQAGAFDKSPDISVVDQAILIVVRLFLGQDKFLKSRHWKPHQCVVQLVWVAQFGSSSES